MVDIMVLRLSNTQTKKITHIGFLSFMGVGAALLPIGLYSLFANQIPTNDGIYIVSALLAGAFIGWINRK